MASHPAVFEEQRFDQFDGLDDRLVHPPTERRHRHQDGPRVSEMLGESPAAKAYPVFEHELVVLDPDDANSAMMNLRLGKLRHATGDGFGGALELLLNFRRVLVAMDTKDAFRPHLKAGGPKHPVAFIMAIGLAGADQWCRAGHAEHYI